MVGGSGPVDLIAPEHVEKWVPLSTRVETSGCVTITPVPVRFEPGLPLAMVDCEEITRRDFSPKNKAVPWGTC